MTYENISLKLAENGFTLEYTEVKKIPRANKNASMYENTTRSYKTKVYKLEEGEEAVKEMARMGDTSIKGLQEGVKALAEKK